MDFFWNAQLSKTSELLMTYGTRELFWYGITIGQWGLGFIVSRKRK